MTGQDSHDATPGKPVWPVWARSKSKCLGVCLLIPGSLDWICQAGSYLLGKTSLGAFADKIAKLSVLFTISYFLTTKGCEAFNSNKTAQIRRREDLQKRIDILSPKSKESATARQLAFGSLKGFLDAGMDSIGKSPESREFYRTTSRLQFSELDLSQLDLAHKVLDRLVARRTDLQRADLTGASLRKAALNAAILWDTLLIGADLDGASLQTTQLAGADLSGANLAEADLSGAAFSDVVKAPNGEYVAGAAKCDAKTSFSRARLRRAVLRHVVFDGVDFSDADLEGALTTGILPTNAYPRFNAASFRNAKLNRTNLKQIDFKGVDLTGADLTDADFADSDLTEAVGVTHLQYESARTTLAKPPKVFAP
jgi:uncharacterized protein YjbI with pentapeptide repeats